jgi:hypothetical protein
MNPGSGTLTTNHENTMQTENQSSKPEDSPEQEAGEGCSGASCSADGLLRDAKEHLYDASVCNRMGKPAHSVGYLRMAMEKLAMAEKALLGQNDWCACEKPGPHFHPGSRGKFCAVCGKDILPNSV